MADHLEAKLTLPYLVNNGPKIRKDALIFLTKSYDMLKLFGLNVLILQKSLFKDIVEFNDSNIFIIKKTSDSLGTFFIFTLLFDNKEDD